MEYILNKTPLKTSNNFGINDIKLDLELPKVSDKLNLNSNIVYKYSISPFQSKIGLIYEQAHDITIDVTKPLYLEYIYDKDELNAITINLNLLSNNNVTIKIKSDDNCYSNIKIVLNGVNVTSNILIANLIDKKANSFIAIENNTKASNTYINMVDFGGKIRLSNYISNIDEKSNDTLNVLYLGKDNDIIDMNYNMNLVGKYSQATMNVYGALLDNAKKAFKGIIDFKHDAYKASGHEKEDTILLSDKVISKSLPMLLCSCEDVDGTHAVSNGLIDPETLFYIMSRGIDENEAKKMMIKAKFNDVIGNIDDDVIKEEIDNYINELL